MHIQIQKEFCIQKLVLNADIQKELKLMYGKKSPPPIHTQRYFLT